jgi:hypothetical protein
MDLEEFSQLLVAHGANLSDWPESERLRAEILIARSPVAAGLLNDAARIDDVLRTSAPSDPAPSAERVLTRLESIPLDVAQRPADSTRQDLPVKAKTT